ncbi:DUF3519 domain-containing protein [Helicobacter pylori]|nr:DUF3519 domain-containing protein [Helicobacter pylori]
MSVKEFKQTLESVENKDRFLEHLKTRENSEERLAALNLVEPTLREPHIEIFTKDKNSAIEKKEYIKAFKDENQARLYMLITQDNDTILRTFITDTPERYVRNHVRNADIIHSFIQPNRTAKSDEALNSVVVYGENTTKKPLTSQEDLLKTQENPLKTQDLSPLELAKAEKLAKLESEKIKEVSQKSAEETKKGIKRDYSDTNLSNDEIKKLIDESPRTGSSMPILGMQNLNAEAVEYIQKNHKRIAVEKIDPSFAKDLKLKYPDDARAVIDYQAINHILKEHKNLSYEDIANYRELSKQANETLKLKDNQNRPVVASFNQINGFFVVVEQVSNAKNELMLKTIYKARGNYKDSLIYKKILAKSQNSN